MEAFFAPLLRDPDPIERAEARDQALPPPGVRAPLDSGPYEGAGLPSAIPAMRLVAMYRIAAPTQTKRDDPYHRAALAARGVGVATLCRDDGGQAYFWWPTVVRGGRWWLVFSAAARTVEMVGSGALTVRDAFFGSLLAWMVDSDSPPTPNDVAGRGSVFAVRHGLLAQSIIPPDLTCSSVIPVAPAQVAAETGSTDAALADLDSAACTVLSASEDGLYHGVGAREGEDLLALLGWVRWQRSRPEHERDSARIAEYAAALVDPVHPKRCAARTLGMALRGIGGGSPSGPGPALPERLRRARGVLAAAAMADPDWGGRHRVVWIDWPHARVCRDVRGGREFNLTMAEGPSTIPDRRIQVGPWPRPSRCPTCDSPDPARHPAMHDGEVQVCANAFHTLTDTSNLTLDGTPGVPK